jgi:hypothetical protein
MNGRGGEIRTPDPLVPNQMRYQAALRPDFYHFSVLLRSSPNLLFLAAICPKDSAEDVHGKPRYEQRWDQDKDHQQYAHAR